MAKRDVLPVLCEYTATRCVQAERIAIDAIRKDATKLSGLVDSLYTRIDALESAMNEALTVKETAVQAKIYKDAVLCAMKELRAVADEAEKVVPSDKWPFPTYANLLFGV